MQLWGRNKGTIIIWNYEQNKTVATLKGHMNQCSAIGVQSNTDYEQLMVSGSKDTNVKVWDTRNKN